MNVHQVLLLHYVLTEQTISFNIHNKPVRFHYPHLTNEKNKAQGGKILLKVTQVWKQDSNPDLSKIFPMSGVSNLLPRSLLLWWVGIIYLLKIHSLGRRSDLTTVWGRAGWSGPKCPMTNPTELSQWDLTLGPTYHNKFSCPYLLFFFFLIEAFKHQFQCCQQHFSHGAQSSEDSDP